MLPLINFLSMGYFLDSDCAGLKSQDVKAECEKDLKTSPRRASPSAAQTSPKPELDKNSDSVSDNDEEALSKVGGGPSPVAEPKAKSLETEYEKAIINGEFSLKVVLETTLKRPHSGRSDESPPAKRKHEESTVSEVVFDEKKSPDCVKLSNDPASPGVETAMDETNTPDLTCSEQLPTNCVSPDPYTNEYPRNDRFFGNGVGGEQNGSELKEKDCSSSFDEVKPEKPTNRKSKGRRERKTRVPSSQSSFEGSECLNGPSNGTSVTLIPSPTRAPKYNFTEGLGKCEIQ